jgi:hypothetical protein
MLSEGFNNGSDVNCSLFLGKLFVSEPYILESRSHVIPYKDILPYSDRDESWCPVPTMLVGGFAGVSIEKWQTHFL